MDVRTGKTILTTSAPLKSKTPQEILFVNPPGPPPYQNGAALSVIRLDPNTLKNQSLSLPLPHPAGISFDESPTRDVRVTGDNIEAIYAGYQGKPGPSSPPANFLARYSFSAGSGQQPQITTLDKPEWPAPSPSGGRQSAGASPTPPTLTGVYLQPTELMGETLPDYPGTRKLYVHLTKDGGAKIFGGVNTFAGTCTLGDTYHSAGYDMVGIAFPLKFGSLAPTTKATGPPATQALENKFLKTLRATTGYRGEGSTVAFIEGNKIIARFKTMAKP